MRAGEGEETVEASPMRGGNTRRGVKAKEEAGEGANVVVVAAETAVVGTAT